MAVRKPKLMVLPVGSFKVDQYAQRTYDPKWAEKLAKNWVPEKEQVYRVSRRGVDSHGKPLDFVVDGQHRAGAHRYMKDGHVLVPTLVYEGLTIEEEAQMHLALNAENKKPTPIDNFRLSLVAEDPTAVAIQSVLDKHGLRVEAGQGPHAVASVGSLKWLYGVGGQSLLDEVLTVLGNAWPTERETRAGELLKGMGFFITKTRNQGVDMTSLTKRLAGSGTPTGLLGRAKQHRYATGRPLWEEVAHRYLDLYNHRRTTGRVAL